MTERGEQIIGMFNKIDLAHDDSDVIYSLGYEMKEYLSTRLILEDDNLGDDYFPTIYDFSLSTYFEVAQAIVNFF